MAVVIYNDRLLHGGVKPILIVNQLAFPIPKRGLSYEIATMVNEARNANGVMTGQRIGRDILKLNNLEWPYLPAAAWEDMLEELEKFNLDVVFWDSRTNGYLSLSMYPGNRSADPMWMNKNTGAVTYYVNCKCNLISYGRKATSVTISPE